VQLTNREAEDSFIELTVFRRTRMINLFVCYISLICFRGPFCVQKSDWLVHGKNPKNRHQLMKKPRKELIPIGDIISGLLTDGTLPFNPDDVDIWNVWEEVVGESFLGNTRPSGIRNKRLRVTVSDSISLQELKFQESAIKEKLNDKLGRYAVDKIEFRVGSR